MACGMLLRMSALEPFTLFRFYYLGFDEGYEYRFRNVHHTATHFGVSVDEIKARLLDWGLDATVVKHVDYNLSKAHSDAQILALEGASLSAREDFAKAAWSGFQVALKRGVSETMIDHLDVISVFGNAGEAPEGEEH